jgi:hypothetical protein
VFKTWNPENAPTGTAIKNAARRNCFMGELSIVQVLAKNSGRTYVQDH